MLKNNYAWTFDVPCCPSRRSETCICPDPFCCGTRTHTYPLFALRETIPEAPGETSVADLTGGNRNMVAQEAIIGHYNKNYDVPYCTFFECWGCMKYYETIEYMGQKLANIRFYNREGCCCPDYPIEDGTDNVIGWFAPKERYICCGSYISLMDLNHQELYGVQAKSCQMTYFDVLSLAPASRTMKS